MSKDINDVIGELLEAEYGEDKPQDLHIDYFYLKVENVTVHRKLITELKKQSVLSWANLEEWPEFVIIQFPKNDQLETERHREERMNQAIRLPILEMLGLQPGPAIIISRACKYTKSVTNKLHLTTGDVQKEIDSFNPLDKHKDLFYLTIKTTSSQVTTILDQIMVLLPQFFCKYPGSWKTLEEQQTWPITFVGYIPKKPFESEREREWRIHEEVRKPLKTSLHEVIKNNIVKAEEIEKLVIVLFSRGCEYKNM